MRQVVRKALAAGALALVGALAIADSASAALACNYNSSSHQLTVTSSGFEEVVALRRDGTDIEITDDAMGGELTCAGGTPTITNTDDIVLDDLPGAVAPAVYFDLKKGYMSPGLTNESPELSEIEIDLEWPDGFFGLGGGNNVDRFAFGQSILGNGVKINKDSDADAFLGTTMSIIVRGEGGKDKLSGKGGPGFIGPTEIPMTIEGGSGGDKIAGGGNGDVLYGEGGKDKVKGLDGRDIIEVQGGGKDKVKCGAGKDEVTADKSDKIAGDCEKVDVS
jgi:Ca2+-binding RTX toxin-like protein